MDQGTIFLSVPKAAWDYIAEAMEEAGMDSHLIAMDPDGRPTVALDLHGFMVTPVGNSDLFINSGKLSDLMVQSNEEAFSAGYAACKAGKTECSGWGEYTPSDDIMELQNNL